MVDPGGDFTEDWVGKYQMETVEVVLVAGAKTEELLWPEKTPKKQGTHNQQIYRFNHIRRQSSS